MSVVLENIVALAKRRGFVYQSAEIYGGLNGVYDAGHLGVLLKRNIRNAWIQSIMSTNSNILLLEGSLIGPHSMWEASGHTKNFSDPMVDCLNCKKRYRSDDIDLEKPCPSCGKKSWTDVRQFQLMFQTNVGAATDNSAIAYLRPETAQSIFVQFKNVMSTNRVKMPFGIAQIGKAFRNEITPKQFLFRMREFEQMEIEWFCKPEEVDTYFPSWVQSREKFYAAIGINPTHITLRPHAKDELSHYSSRTTDVEYEFPFGRKELEGIADRGNFDLTQHSKHSGKDLAVFDEETKQSYTPHVVECSVGVDRLFLALLCDAYTEDIIEGEQRIVLKFAPRIAPIKAAILPLTKKLSEQAKNLYNHIMQLGYMIEFDETGSIGKRYRRQDEIGTPLCITFDFDSLDDNCVTVRDRDTTKQSRISINDLDSYMIKALR
jgi:glycyl-tRNA synthetase, dimeric type